ncbi:MAG TPA: pyridoxal-phosphate dependent enzyme [Anaerolineaceae bacterium]
MIPSAWIDLAARRLHGQVQRTPLTFDPELDLYLKWENRQVTGSFKIRGALNKVLALEGWEQMRGLVTASAGNHGQGVALAGKLVGAPVIVFCSNHAVPAKLAAMRDLGADVRLVQGGYEAAERAAQDFAASHQATWVSPYNDGQVIAGQATVGLEIIEQLAEQHPASLGAQSPGAIIVPVGGGGLIAGIGAALEQAPVRPRLVGVQSAASPFFYELYHHGTQDGVVEQESLADGLAGAVEASSITIPLVRRYVNEFLLVTEAQVEKAVACAARKYGETIEGSAAVALAAVSDGVFHRPQGPVVVVISGGNIQPEVHARICALPHCV